MRSDPIDSIDPTEPTEPTENLCGRVGILPGADAWDRDPDLQTVWEPGREPDREPGQQPRRAPNGVRWFHAPGWEQHPWLWHGFSTRRSGLSRAYTEPGLPGELNLGYTAADDPGYVLENRRRFVEAITGQRMTPLVTLRQIHSNVTVSAESAESADGSAPCHGDGLLTAQTGRLLGILTADCIPVLVADTENRVVAAFHAGWRGTVERIVELGVNRMQREFGSHPRDLIAAIGPGIGPCCYTVGPDLLSAFASRFGYYRDLFRSAPAETACGNSTAGPQLSLDLIEANRRQLLDAGVEPAAIRVVGGCASCRRDLFYSHRASGGQAGRMMAAIGICER